MVAGADSIAPGLRGSMTPELIAIVTVGVALAGVLLTSIRGVQQDINALRGEIGTLREDVSKLRERIARLEGPGVRDLINLDLIKLRGDDSARP